MFNLNQLYIQQAQLISPYQLEASTLNGLTKLSLFTLKDKHKDSNSDEQTFISLLASLDCKVYFIKREQDNFICWDIYASSQPMKSWLKEQISDTGFDFLLWPEKHIRPPKLLIFDMDSTFIQIEVIDELAHRHGVGDSVSKVTEAAMRGELDFSESLISRVACLQGLAESSIDDIANNLPLSSGVARLVELSKLNDINIAIVSGGFTPFVQKLKECMGLYQVRANNLEISDKKLTGKVLGQIVDAQVKADFVNELRDKLNIDKNDILTIGDGANDLLMMKESGFSLAYRAKPAVQAEAKGRMNFTTLDDLLCVFDW